jgi:hypothetical protein
MDEKKRKKLFQHPKLKRPTPIRANPKQALKKKRNTKKSMPKSNLSIKRKMDLDLFTGVDFFCQRAKVPDISVSNAEAQTRYRGIPIAASGGVTYGDLNLKFIVDEEMKNYLTIWKWINQNNLSEEMDDNSDPQYSDGRLTILNSNMNPNVIVVFESLFPVSLTELEFDVEDQDVDYLTADVTFKFILYTFNNKRMEKL